MTPTDAARILGLSPDASPDQLEARYNELRTKLEDKIAKAPTPGLKAKYRESLEEVTQAFETLTLAADASNLPMAKRKETGAPETGDRGKDGDRNLETGERIPAAGSTNRKSRIENRKSSKEFAIVALLALAVLGAGGWWVVKMRAEKAEAARIAAEEARVAAEQKAEAERQAAAQKAEAERIASEKRLADEAEKARQEKLVAQLRARLAEYKITWEAFEREERNAERQLAEVKSELRSLRDVPQPRMNEARATVDAHEDYFSWIRETLSRHPAKISRSRAEEMLSGKQLDEAQAATAELNQHLVQLEAEIAAQKRSLLDLDGELAIEVAPEVEWTVVDFFGRKRSGKGPAKLDDVAFGSAEVQFELAGWAARKSNVVISRSKRTTLSSEYKGFDLTIVTAPEGASVSAGGRALGVTPLALRNMPPGTLDVVVRKEGFYDQTAQLAFPPAAPELSIRLRERAKLPTLPEKPTLPARIRYEARSESVHDMTRSTGAYADSATRTVTLVHAIEDWDFSKADADGQWTEMLRTFVNYSVSGVASTLQNGSVIRYKRGANGSWVGTFERGGTTDAVYNDLHLKHFSPTSFVVSANAYWPPAGTPVGGSWKIKPADLPGFGNFPNLTGQATGRLLAINRGDETDIADIEIRYNIEWFATADYKQPMTGTLRFQVDLRDGYYVRNDSEYSSNTALKAGMAGTLVSDSRSTTSATLKKR
jgi:hypothetical protein